MRLLHVVATEQRRGAEMFAQDLIGQLNSAGVRQRVAILRDTNGPSVGYAASASLLSRRGWRVPGLRIDVGTLTSMARLVHAWRPDVIQAHGGEPLKYSILSNLGRGTPVVYRRIGVAPPTVKRGVRRAIYGSLIRRAARIVAVAEAVRLETMDLFRVPSERIIMVPRGIDARRLAPVKGREATRRSLRISPEAPVIISLGALTWEKDPSAHVDVLSRVLRKRPDAVHLLAGDGPLRPELEGLIARRGLGRNVRVLGSRSDVADLLAASDVMILVSRIEGMPGCLIEAGMAGLPVVAYAVGGVSEIVADGATGFTVSPRDLDGLASRLLELLRNRELRVAMGQKARAHCRGRFDIESVAPRYLDVYRQVTGSS